MKKSIKLLAIVVAMLVLATLIVACKPAAQETKYTVTFDADGGTPVPAAQEVKEGEKATKPQDPTKAGFTFLGWYNGETKYTFEEKVTANITLKAKWQAESTEPETATTEEVTYTGKHGPANVTIKLAIEYEVESHRIVELLLAEDNVYCTSNWTDKWEAGFDAVVESYIGMTLEEVVAIDALEKGDENVVTGATESSRGLLAAVQMAALTVVPAPVETATTQEVTYTGSHPPVNATIVLSIKYEVESHKIVEIIFGEGCVFTTNGYESNWEAGEDKAVKAYIGMTLEEVIALDAPSGNQIVTGATQTSKALLAAIKMAAGTVGSSDSEFVVNTATGELTGYTGTDSEVVIPSKVGDITITKIGDGAFANNTTITKVTIPNTVTSISAGAFTGASNLTEVVFEQGGTSPVMISGSFKDLTKLATVTLPSKSSLMTSAFEGCTSLATISGLENVTVIQDRAFFGCTSLTSVTTSAMMIGESAFEGCTALTSVTINAGSFMNMSAKYIFKGCTALETFEIPKVVTDISTTSFEGCSSLTLTVADGNSKYFAADGVLFSGSNLVYVPAGVTTFEIPASITNIGNMQSTFADASKITGITVNAENTKFVADNGVLYTAGYKQLLFIPSSIGATFEIRPETTTVGVMAFAYSTGIETITVNEANTKFKVIDGILYFETDSNAFYLVTVADRTAAKEATILGGNADYRLSTVMKGAFDFGKLTGIKFMDPDHIGTGWTSVVLGESMTIKAAETCKNKINSNMSQYKDKVEYFSVESFTVNNEAELRNALNLTGVKKVVLGSDIGITPVDLGTSTLSPSIVINSDITFNLNGHKLYVVYDGEAVFTSTICMFSINGANVVINGEGTLDTEAGDNNSYGINVINGGSLTINGGNYYGAISAVQVQKGSLVINGGHFDLATTVKELYPSYVKYIINCIDANFKDGSATITINGGTFVGIDYSANPEGEGTTYIAEGRTVTSEQHGDETWYTVKAA